MRPGIIGRISPTHWPQPKTANPVGIVLVTTGGGGGTWQRIDDNFNAISPDSTYFDEHPTYAGIVDQIIDGQAMVSIPKFWVQAGTVPSGSFSGKRYWMISEEEVDGFYVHPAFMLSGDSVAQFWVGKYTGTKDGVSKLGSAAGVLPLVSNSIPAFITKANARNVGGVTGFQLWDIYQLSAIQLLMLIETGSTDFQNIIGPGNSVPGGVLNTDNAVVATASWRGIVGLWGNVDQFVDGISDYAGGYYRIWDKNGNKTYVVTDVVSPAADYGTRYAITTAVGSGVDFDLTPLFLPGTVTTSVGGGSFSGDTTSTTTGMSARIFGGSYGAGNTCGMFSLRAYPTSSSSAAIGGRLSKK